MSAVKPLVLRIRRLLEQTPDEVNPYDLLQLSLEFLMYRDLMRGASYVCLDENQEGFDVVGGYRSPLTLTGLAERKLVDIRILMGPEEWRESMQYQLWRMRKSEGFQ